MARAPDHDLGVEESILGGILNGPQLIDLPDLAALEPGHFYDFKHRVVFAAMRNLRAANRPIDVVTVEGEIVRAGHLEAIGGVAFLGELHCRVPTVDNAIDYVRTVQTHARNRQAMVVISEALTRAQRWPHELSELVSELRGEIDRDLAKLETGISQDPFDFEIRRALVDVRAKIGTGRAKKRKPLFSVDAATLLSKAFSGQQWLVNGLITRGGTGVIGGLPKAAKKTWLGTEIAVAVATGTKVCGEFFAERGTVAYFYAEDMERQIRNRLRALLAGADRQMPVDRLFAEPRGEFLDVTQDEDLAWIVASCRKFGHLDLLVLDPLRDISSAAEDKSDEMSPVMRRLRLIGEILGCTILVVHHAGKPNEANGKRSGGQRLRGSSAIHGSVDSGIYFLECEGNGVSTFKNKVESEIKGARSAGIFTLNLEIEDDASGEAVRATWSVTAEVGTPKPSATVAAAVTKAEQDAADDDRVFAFVRELATRGESHSRRKLRDHNEAPLSDQRMRDSMDRLIEVGRLKLVGCKVRIPEPEQFYASQSG